MPGEFGFLLFSAATLPIRTHTLAPSYDDFNFPDRCDAVSKKDWAMRDHKLPHFVVLMCTSIDAGQNLLQSEITVILKIMHGRLRSRSTRPHTIAPVRTKQGRGMKQLILTSFRSHPSPSRVRITSESPRLTITVNDLLFV
jgi:hypothetical protein